MPNPSCFMIKECPSRSLTSCWGIWDRRYEAWVRDNKGSIRKFASKRGALLSAQSLPNADTQKPTCRTVSQSCGAALRSLNVCKASRSIEQEVAI
jgi:hypothetical protein